MLHGSSVAMELWDEEIKQYEIHIRADGIVGYKTYIVQVGLRTTSIISDTRIQWLDTDFKCLESCA